MSHWRIDHTVEWERRYNFGFGMLGEQGAESILLGDIFTFSTIAVKR